MVTTQPGVREPGPNRRLGQLVDVSNAKPTASQVLAWDAVTGRWTASAVATLGLADGAVTYAKLNADVLTGLDPRYVNVAGDTMTGALTMDAQINMGAGQRIDFPDEAKDDKIDLWGGSHLIGVASSETKYAVPAGAKHAFRVNAVEKFNVQGATVQALTRLEQSGDYAYLGNFNAGTPTYPRAGTDLAVAWNFGGGSREMTFWNTDTSPASFPFEFRQLTGAGTSSLLMRIGFGSSVPNVQIPDGTASVPGWNFFNDTDTGWRRPGTDTMGAIVGTLAGITVSAVAGAVRLGFFGGGAAVKAAVTGSRGANAALASLLTALAGYGLITDSSTA